MFSLSRALLLIVGLGFLADLGGMLSPALSLFMGLGFLVLGLLTVRRTRENSFRAAPLATAVALILAALALLALSPGDRVNRLLCAAVLLIGCDLALGAFGRECRGLHPVASIAAVSGLFFLILRFSPLAWKGWVNASEEFTATFGDWLGQPVHLGPTFSGFNVTAFFVISAIVLFAFSHRRNWLRLPLTLVYLGATGLLFIAIMTQLPNLSLPTLVPEHPTLFEKYVTAWAAKNHPGLLPLIARHVPWDAPVLLFLMQLPALWVIAGRAVIRRSTLLPQRANRFSAGVAILMALFGVGLLVVRLPERPRMETADSGRPRVVLYEKGFVNWDFPTHDSYGSTSGGMLGRLPAFLDLLGFEVVKSPTLDADALAGARVVAIFNIIENLPHRDRTALWDWVRAGGSLLVVADHTWLNDDGENNLEYLLEPCNIRFRFDSATYRLGGWIFGYDYRAEPVFHRIGQDLNQPCIGVGASLELHRSAQPMLLGRNGYSDLGNPERSGNRGYLGDGLYRPGERLGDLVLIAQQPYGAGRVIAVGDTGPFVNLFMVENHEVPTRLFARLAAAPVIPYHVLRLELALTGFVIALFFFVVGGKRAMVTALVVALASAVGMQAFEAWAASPLDLNPRGDIAWISSSQVEAYARESWRPDGLNGLYLNLMRDNLQPLRADSLRYDKLCDGRMLFLIAPARRLTDRQADDIERFIGRGGYVVVAAGRRQRDAVAPLLGRFGLGITDRPLGRFETGIVGQPARAQFHESFEVEDRQGGAVALARFDLLGYPAGPVMLEKRVPVEDAGRVGALLLIGDADFFTNKNIEEETTWNSVNIDFIRWLADHARRLQSGAPAAAGEARP